MRFFIFLLIVAITAPLRAQLGDAIDKPGVVQASLVPKELIPPAPALSPKEALKTFKVAAGYHLELVASEPLIEDPVAIQFGSDGRCWVVEFRGYMLDFEATGEDLPTGRIVVLSDRDSNGQYHKSTIFVDNIVLPRALHLVADGILVGAPPYLKFWRDSKGTGKADTSITIADDYGIQVDPKRPELSNPERAPNSLLWGLDNWIYSCAYTKRFKYAQGQWITDQTTFRGQWGLSQDNFGHLFHNSNSDQLRADVIPSLYLGRNPNYTRAQGTNVLVAENQLTWPVRVTPGTNRAYKPETMRDGKLKEFTAACAPWIYRANDLPAEFYGNAFVCEPSANLIKRNIVSYPHGSIASKEAYHQMEFIASVDERFRPVNLTTGPDGGLYIVDFYRGLIEDQISLTSYLRHQAEDRDLLKNPHLGRIYRVVPDNQKPQPFPRLDLETPSQLVADLADTNSWKSETAQRLLVEKGDLSVVPVLKHEALYNSTASGRLHALCVLEGLNSADIKILSTCLHDPEAYVRTAAIRISEPFLRGPQKSEILPRLLELSKDSSDEVQQQLVLSLGEAKDIATDLACVKIVQENPKNVYLLDALFSGIYERELPLLKAVLADASLKDHSPENQKIVSGLAKGITNSRSKNAVTELISLATSSAEFYTQSLIEGIAASTEVSPVKQLSLSKESPELIALTEHATPQAKRVLVRINKSIVWPGKVGATLAAPPAALTAEEQIRFETGRTLFTNVCSACHQVHGRGLEGLAPALADSEWINGTAARPVRVVINGAHGPIRVAGRSYNLDMPPLGVLSDDQIACILTYVRRAWGNTGSPVTQAYVAHVRIELGDRKEPWTQPELLKIK